MARFFNPKEDVIDIQLTQYGKSMLSKGKFRPDSYAFFDNDILYDSAYTNLSESQNDAQQRIMELTPRLQTQYVYRGIETDLQKGFDTMVASGENVEKINIQQVEEREYALGMPIGTSDSSTIYRPSWDIGFYKAELSGTMAYHTGSSGRDEQIPQLDCIYEFETGIILQDDESDDISTSKSDIADRGYRVPYDATTDEPYALHELFEDDTYFYIREDNYVFLDVLEHNTQDEVENFEIEVFKVEKESNPNVSDGGTLREVLIPLKFFKKDENINPYSEDEILDTALAPTGLDETFVEYYFDIEVDNGIGPEVLCELLSRHRRNKQFDGMFSDLDVDLSTDCEDFRFMHEIGSKSNVLSTTENVNASEEECE